MDFFKGAPIGLKIMAAILALMVFGWFYDAIEPFIYYFTGFGFVWDYAPLKN